MFTSIVLLLYTMCDRVYENRSYLHIRLQTFSDNFLCEYADNPQFVPLKIIASPMLSLSCVKFVYVLMAYLQSELCVFKL